MNKIKDLFNYELNTMVFETEEGGSVTLECTKGDYLDSDIEGIVTQNNIKKVENSREYINSIGVVENVVSSYIVDCNYTLKISKKIPLHKTQKARVILTKYKNPTTGKKLEFFLGVDGVQDYAIKIIPHIELEKIEK